MGVLYISSWLYNLYGVASHSGRQLFSVPCDPDCPPLPRYNLYGVANHSGTQLYSVPCDPDCPPLPRYNLYGVANHSGTVYSGHYTAYCKHPHTAEWYEFNDSRYAILLPVAVGCLPLCVDSALFTAGL